MGECKITWDSTLDDAFNMLKEKLCQATALTHATNHEKATFKLFVDASKLGYGAILHVKTPDSKERPVSFLSRSLKPAES